MSIKKLKKKQTRSKKVNSVIPPIPTPYNKKFKEEILTRLKEKRSPETKKNSAPETNLICKEWNKLSDSRLDQLATAITITLYHINRFPNEVQEHHISDVKTSGPIEHWFVGISIIPKRFKEAAFFVDDNHISFFTDREKGTYIQIPLSLVYITDEQMDKFKRGLKLIKQQLSQK